MNKNHIQGLLDKYFEGETSLAEEKELKKFFNKTAVLPEEWKPYRQMFTYFETEGRKTMPVKKDIQHRKNMWWLTGVGISLAASVLILLTVIVPSTKTQLQPLATETQNIDSFYASTKETKKSDIKKPVKSESKKSEKTKSVPAKTILDDDSSTLLAGGVSSKRKESSLDATINNALAPLDQMQDFKKAMDKCKYFDLMNKYLPNIDISSLMQKAK